MVVSQELGVQGVIMGGWEIVKVSLHSSLSGVNPTTLQRPLPLTLPTPHFFKFCPTPSPQPQPQI